MVRWTTRRTAAVVATALLATALGTGTAWAAETPAPSPTFTTSVNGNQVSITTDLATVRAGCARVAGTQKRLTALIARIQAGADTPGSAASLRARAQQATAAGHTDRANVLTARATLRADRVPALQQALARLTTVDTEVCAALPAAGQ
jgi:hypothetical protein